MKRMFGAALMALALAAGGCADAATATKGASASGDGVRYDAALNAKLPASVRSRGEIRLVTDASYAPMEQFAADGQTIIGFEPDLASALGSVLGIKITMVHGDFDTSLADVDDGAYDGVLSSMNDTLEREKKADFVDYFQAGTSIVVQRGNPRGITDLNDLCGQIVATEEGTVQDDLLHRSQHSCGSNKMTIKEFKTNADALLQVRMGRAVAILNDYPPAAYLAGDVKTRAYYQLASTVQYEPGLFGIALAKSSPELRDALRAALDRLIRSGAYNELLQRWNLIGGGLAASSVNAGSGPASGS
jgi:polar amino acid transport system substrate-binding protein